jgi:hypothetical protein
MAITFQAERLIGRLNALEGTQIKYAGTQAMKRLGWEMRSELGRHMAATFNDPVQYTIDSAMRPPGGGTRGGLRVGIFIDPRGDEKGQSPASYLFPLTPQSDGKPLRTRFNKALYSIGATTGAEFNAATYWMPASGVPRRGSKVEPGFLQAILSGLKNEAGRKGTLKDKRSKYGDRGTTRFFINPDMRNPAKKAEHLKPGIYRVKAGQAPERLMSLVEESSLKVPQKFDFEGVVRDRSAALLPGLLRAELTRALR